MVLASLRRLGTLRVLSAGLLVGLFGTVAFLLACHEMRDNDVWWHLRAGEWLVQNRRFPRVDPFCFGSGDHPWINLHWLFQVVLYLVHQAAGIPGTILLSAGLAAAAVLVALAGRPRGAALPVVLFGWLPALLLAADRFCVRPEMLTLLFLAAFLAILAHLDEQPRLAWALPVLQLLWVNTHGLFVLGPIVLGFRLLDQAVRPLLRAGRAGGLPGQSGWWRHVGGASVAVVLVCLVNPHGLSGALHPFVDLYPKVSGNGNPYKTYIEEFRTPQSYVRSISLEQAGNKGCFCAFHFLMVLLPVSFLLPALWRAAEETSGPEEQAGPTPPAPRSSGPLAWLAVLAGSVLLLAVHTLTLAVHGRPGWVVSLGQAVPYLLGGAGVAGGLLLARRSWSAAGLAVVAGASQAAWMLWLANSFTAGTGPHSWPVALVLAVLGWGVASVLVLRQGGNLFHLCLAGAFAYLALKATNSLSRLGLVAGFLLSWEIAPWVGRLLAGQSLGRGRAWAGCLARTGLAALLLGWAAAILTQWHGNWFAAYPLGLHEQPLAYAHEASRFAGQPDMPRRAVVYDLEQACVHVYHADPGQRTLMDARLSVFSLETFRTYVAIEGMLRRGDPLAVEALEAFGEAVVLLSHEGLARGEARLLRHPRWRLVYFDAQAAVFLPRGRRALEARFPTLDLGSRPFLQPRAASRPDEPGAAWKEGMALYNLAEALREPPSAGWTERIPILLAALDRADRALDEGPSQSANWALAGLCHWALLPSLHGPPAHPPGNWSPWTDLGWAQATWCFRRGHLLAPEALPPLRGLYHLHAGRRLADAQYTVGRRLLALGDLSAEQAAEVRLLSRRLGAGQGHLQAHDDLPPANLPAVLPGLLQAGRTEEAVRLVEQACAGGKVEWDWGLADRLAAACMHLGRPELARHLWRGARKPPSPAVRECRLGDTFWVERDFPGALRHYHAARRLGPGLPEPCWALAWLHAQRGEAGEALAACRAGLALALSEPMRAELRALEELLRVRARPAPAAEAGRK